MRATIKKAIAVILMLTGSTVSYGQVQTYKPSIIPLMVYQKQQDINYNKEKQEGKELEIISHDIPDTGLASAYTSYSFSLKNNIGGTLTNIKWEYQLQKTQGEYEVVSEGTGTSFSISPVEDESEYYHNIDKCIVGRILCTGVIDGREIRAVYNIALELKPLIDGIHITRLKYDETGDFYDIDLTIEYKGSNYVGVYLEEEYNPQIKVQHLYEPSIAHARYEKVFAAYDAWVYVKATNEYGEVVDTLAIQAYPKAVPLQFDKPNLSEEELAKRGVLVDKSNRSDNNIKSDRVDIRVFDKNGVFVKSIENKSEMSGMSPGLYILKYYQNGICYESETYYKR